MNKTLVKFLMFAAGATIGSAATWYCAKKYYDQTYNEKFTEMRNYYREKYGLIPDESADVKSNSANDKGDDKPVEQLNEQMSIKEYADLVAHHGYRDYTGRGRDVKKEEEEKDVVKPYVIPPDDLGETDYPVVSLVYYADGVLADDFDDPIEDVDDIVGLDFAEHFGEYEKDSVFVRNDRTHSDYEICRDLRNFSDVVENDLYPTEDE